MSLWIEGWVEVTSDKVEEEHEHSWEGVLRLLPLIDAPDDVSETLFGLSKQAVAGSSMIECLASRRGVPRFPSKEVKSDLAKIEKHENEFGSGEFGGYTHALWSELENSSATLDEKSDWQLVFNFVRQILKQKPSSRLRFVVWYSW